MHKNPQYDKMTNENLNPTYAGEGMYRENILDHYKNPHNHGELKNPDIKFTENNPLCGDVLTVNLKLNNHNIGDVKFRGRGCAISQSAMSMLNFYINRAGKNLPKERKTILDEAKIELRKVFDKS